MAVPDLLAERIERVAIDSIEPHPANPNEGDVGQIAGSVEAVGGFYQVVFVQRSTGRIVAGEHRWRTLKAMGAEEAPVVFLDVNDEQAARILAADNEIPRNHSRPITDKLAALLTDLAQQTDAGLAGTGFDGAALDDLIALAAGPPALPDVQQQAGAPEEHDFWPVVRLVVPPGLKVRYEETVGHLRTDEERLAFLLDR